ncbi:hypothetical protein, partial [Bradyrhizobium retamae]|uniref:hypothetical protein n=1 Tax=Bradyrhizobium retamae TaxID=1300035 RepID=UPI001FD9DCB9
DYRRPSRVLVLGTEPRAANLKTLSTQPSFILIALLGSASSLPGSQQPGRSHKKSLISFFRAFQPHLPALLPQLRSSTRDGWRRSDFPFQSYL